MKFKTSFTVFAWFFLVLFAYVGLSAEGWKQEKNKNGIKVFTRPVEGSPLKEFLGKTTINAKPEELVALIKNVSTYKEWAHDCKDAKLLKENGSNQWYIYIKNGAPWPVSDRDVVIQSTLTQSKDGKITISMKESSSPSVASPSGVVRIPRFRGSWKITPREDGRSDISYQAHTDPGGNIPDIAANLVVVDIPYNTLFNMQRRFP